MNRLFLVLGVVLCLLVGGTGFASSRGTPDQAKAMVEEAAAFVKAVGAEKALVEFNNPKGNFVRGDLYIFALDFNGLTLAHGANQKLVGKNLSEVKDADGKLFMKAMIDLAKEKGKGWVEYKWTNPESKKIEPKASYLITVGDLFLGCGAYK